MKEKLKVLLIGAAFSADLHMDGYARMLDKVEIVGIVDRDLSRVSALAERYGITGYTPYDSFERAIAEAECDLVDICMPNFLHHEIAMLAMEKGRHIVCEKPLATTVADGEEMIATAQKKGLHIYYAEDWLGSPAMNKALDIINSGKLGKLLYVRARECHNGSHSPFAQKIALCGGGCMIHLGVHPVGFMLAMKNNEWDSVVAMTSGGLDNNLKHTAMEGEDFAAAIMRFKDGTFAVMEGNYVTQGGMEDYIDFYCSEGCLHVDLTFSSALRAFSIPGLEYTVEKADITTGWSNPAVDEKYNLGYVAEIAHFVDCAANDREARIGLRGMDGLEALRVINKIYQSAKEGVTIKNEK